MLHRPWTPLSQLAAAPLVLRSAAWAIAALVGTRHGQTHLGLTTQLPAAHAHSQPARESSAFRV